MRNLTGLACPAGKLNGRFKWHLFILLLTRQNVSRLTATYLGWRSPHGLPKKRFPKFFGCAPLVEDSPTAMQMPTTGQPDNRRMWLGKWIKVEILITGCHTFLFNLVVRISGETLAIWCYTINDKSELLLLFFFSLVMVVCWNMSWHCKLVHTNFRW